MKFNHLLATACSALAVMALVPTAASATQAKAPPAPKGIVPTFIDALSATDNTFGSATPQSFAPSSATSIVSSFEGTSDYDTRALGIGLIPPDTNGAVGKTQYVELINGSFSVYDKATGALQAPRKTDSAFWTAAGGTNTGGDPRISYDAGNNRWLAIGFGANVANLQIAVSETSDALGPWHASSFTGFAGFGFGATADYPTLSISGNAILIGTNNFARSSAAGANSFRGTTVNVLNKKAVFAAGSGAPGGTVTQFVTPFNGTTQITDNGFAIQGVNRRGGSSTVDLVAASLLTNDDVTFSLTNAGRANVAKTATLFLSNTGLADYNGPAAARQPTTNGSARVLDALDDRISSQAWEIKGKIYFVNTVRALGTDHDVVRITVLDKASGRVLSQTDVGGGPSDKFDYFQGSIAVNGAGQLVVGYNRSGNITTGAGASGQGRLSIFARSFNTNPDGTLSATSGEIFIKQSLVDDYHNGSAQGVNPAGRQRFGDYSSVTLDPTNSSRFWVIGEFAREYNNAAGGHPGGSGFGRWGTFVAQIGIATVPEPQSWALMIAGFGLVGGALRRQRKNGFASA